MATITSQAVFLGLRCAAVVPQPSLLGLIGARPHDTARPTSVVWPTK